MADHKNTLDVEALDTSNEDARSKKVEMVNHQKLNETIVNRFKLVDITIKDVQSNKKTVASTLDMVISLMGEVECKEKAAEQAKEEAAASGLHILARVDELKQSWNRAKETNAMRYREMYAQKEVLASELKELLFRMSGMLNEGGESLGVLDQMRTALEERLASAIIDKEFADTEKLQKELCAQEALTNEVNQMKKVVEASERMNRHAVKISKLQEYLIDCSHVVNMLRGDESDKCEHVNLLKELLDLEFPLNEILSSSQTSSILAPIKPHHEPQPKRVDKNETPKESADSLVLSDFAKISDKGNDVNMLKEKLDYAVPLPSNKSSLEKVYESKNVVADIAKEGRAMSSECLAVLESTITCDDFGENPKSVAHRKNVTRLINREISDLCKFPIKEPSGGISSAPPSLSSLRPLQPSSSLTRPPTPHTLNHYVPSPPPSQLLQQPNFYTPAVTPPPPVAPLLRLPPAVTPPPPVAPLLRLPSEPAKSHVDPIVLETSLGFGLDDDHVQGTTKEPRRREESVTLKPPIFFIRRELLSKTPNMDLKKQKVNKNLAFGADLNNSPSVSDIFTQVGHAQSTEGSVACGQTYDQGVASQSTKSSSTRFQEISTGRSKKGKGRKKGKVTSRSLISDADDDLCPIDYSDFDEYGYDGVDYSDFDEYGYDGVDYSDFDEYGYDGYDM